MIPRETIHFLRSFLEYLVSCISIIFVKDQPNVSRMRPYSAKSQTRRESSSTLSSFEIVSSM